MLDKSISGLESQISQYVHSESEISIKYSD
jgi:hypothetical protein